MTSFWTTEKGPGLAQGDYLPNCLVPMFNPDFGDGTPNEGDETVPKSVDVKSCDLIVVTQSCDLENNKVAFAALCPISTIESFSKVDERFKKPSRRDEVRKGRLEGLHMLGCPQNPESNAGALVVDFRQIHSLPVTYLNDHATSLGNRWRLQSPFLEHFSQAFARFFMRVGLPSAIEPFK